MAQYYSKSSGGFYDSEIHGARNLIVADPAWVPPVINGEPDPAAVVPLIEIANPATKIPPDAVEITGEQHAALLQGCYSGQVIEANTAGMPVLADPPPAALADVKVGLVAGVDDAISAIYYRFTRFEIEYVQREAAARAFKAAAYVGDAGLWVTSFSASTGISAQAAADLIISQADAMRAALQALGALRMGKYGIAAAADAPVAQAVHDDILLRANAIAASL